MWTAKAISRISMVLIVFSKHRLKLSIENFCLGAAISEEFALVF